MLRNVINEKLINKTFLVCHHGNNYSLIKRLAAVGSNVCIVHSISKHRQFYQQSLDVANQICDFTKSNNVITLECNYQHLGHIKNTLNEVEDTFQNIDGLVIYKDMLWENKLLLEKFVFHHGRYANVFVTDPDLYTKL